MKRGTAGSPADTQSSRMLCPTQLNIPRKKSDGVWFKCVLIVQVDVNKRWKASNKG